MCWEKHFGGRICGQGASSLYGDEEAERKLIFRPFSFPFLFNLDSQPRKWCHPPSVWVSLSSNSSSLEFLYRYTQRWALQSPRHFSTHSTCSILLGHAAVRSWLTILAVDFLVPSRYCCTRSNSSCLHQQADVPAVFSLSLEAALLQIRTRTVMMKMIKFLLKQYNRC